MASYHRAIILGGAQLGRRYGITNGQFLSQAQLYELLDKAWYLGFHRWDLAQSYGCAEARMGLWLRSRHSWQSRKPSLGSKISLMEEPDRTRQNLRLSRVRLAGMQPAAMGYGLDYVLLHAHRPGVLARQLQVLAQLCRNRQRPEKIGLSLYYPSELENLLDLLLRGACPPIDVLQLPYNLADRRFEPYFAQLAGLGLTLQLRSLYMQGVLLQSTAILQQQNFAFLHTLCPLIEELDEFGLQEPNLLRQDLLLYFALRQIDSFAPDTLHLVVGISNSTELLKLHHSIKRLALWPEHRKAQWAERFEGLKASTCCLEEKVLVPALWPKH